MYFGDKIEWDWTLTPAAAEAESALREAYQLFRRISRDHPELPNAARLQGRDRETLPLLREAVELKQKQGGDEADLF